jgi:RNA polymerase sigma factor for flagellar operon FliA
MKSLDAARGDARPGLNVAKSIAERNEYVTKYYKCVERVAHRLRRRLPAHVEIGDLISAGVLGLIEAAERFDPGQSIRFETFAEFRIKGAMLDDLRGRDTLTRDMRRIFRELSESAANLAHRLGRTPTEGEVADALGVPVEELHNRKKKTAGSSVVGFEEAGADFIERTEGDPADNPYELAARRELFNHLANQIDLLPQRMQQVLALYYCEGLGLKEVGVILGVTESRACQIHAEAAKRLRAALGDSFFDEASS